MENKKNPLYLSPRHREALVSHGIMFFDDNGLPVREFDKIRLHIEPFGYDIEGYLVFNSMTLAFNLKVVDPDEPMRHIAFHTLEQHSEYNDGKSTTPVVKTIFRVDSEYCDYV